MRRISIDSSWKVFGLGIAAGFALACPKFAAGSEAHWRGLEEIDETSAHEVEEMVSQVLDVSPN